jgi:hypothetical protein
MRLRSKFLRTQKFIYDVVHALEHGFIEISNRGLLSRLSLADIVCQTAFVDINIEISNGPFDRSSSNFCLCV